MKHLIYGAFPTDEEYKEMLDQYIQETKERNLSSIVVETNGVRIHLPPGTGVSISRGVKCA